MTPTQPAPRRAVWQAAGKLVKSCAAILTVLVATAGHADDRIRPETLPSSDPLAGSASEPASNGCARPIGQITVAMLNNAPIVTLFANGAPVTLILDTGAERTVLSPAAAERIGAQAPRIEFQRKLRGVAGTLPSREVELRSFTAGDVPIPWRRVVVAPVTMTRVFTSPLDGLLGADVLAYFDLDLDLPHHRMIFYESRSCPPAWTGRYTGISAGRSRGEHLFFPVELDGRTITAIVDTGSQNSVLTAATGRSLGVTETILARDQPVTIRGAAGESLTAHLHRFSELRVGDEIIRNPALFVADIHLRDADIVLGIDYLGPRRMWLSYRSFRIFLSRPTTAGANLLGGRHG